MKVISVKDLCPSQVQNYVRVKIEHPEAVIIMCGDEKTGERFGTREKRAGHCKKIGSGGRNKGEIGYQLWTTWAPVDLKFAEVSA